MNENDSSLPIGVFDSGLGGLSAVKELVHLLPNEDIIYFGDTGRVPYGTRSNEIINKYANQDIRFLASKNVKIVVIACGTVSSVYEKKDNSTKFELIGVLHPTCLKAAETTKNYRIGVIGTSATIRNKAYVRQLMELNPKLKIFDTSCPLFVPLIENGFISHDNEITRLTVEYYLKNIKSQNVDTLILGCTHYPLISDIISDYMGKDVTLINSGKETAMYVKNKLEKLHLMRSGDNNGTCEFYTSDDVEGFRRIARLFLGKNKKFKVEKVDIEKF